MIWCRKCGNPLKITGVRGFGTICYECGHYSDDISHVVKGIKESRS
ncbi:MAG: hypothetical protein QHH15_00425 [Candidatus Thermoplasmatota archaeon]|nr:hypothetical protein [Candidatus Thermoplasmatota archaeon]MDH7506239.1 hypothetical protein [Candidatus Thermoplasmatota archaeon]